MDRIRGKKEAAASGAGRKLVALWHRGGRAVYRAPWSWPGAEPALLPITGEGLLGSEPRQQGWVAWARQHGAYDWKARRCGTRAHQCSQQVGGQLGGRDPEGAGKGGEHHGHGGQDTPLARQLVPRPLAGASLDALGATDGRRRQSGRLHSSKRFLVKSLGEVWGQPSGKGLFYFLMGEN